MPHREARLPTRPQRPVPGQQLVESTELDSAGFDLVCAIFLFSVIGILVVGGLFQAAGPTRSDLILAWIFVSIPLLIYTTGRLFRSISWGVVVTLGIIFAAGTVRSPVLAMALHVLPIGAAIYVALRLRLSALEWVSCALAVLVTTIAALGVDDLYTSFDMASRARAGALHNDTLYHASIAAMIKNYGVVSTGLHGLVETPYHTFSHTLVAGFSRLSGAGVLNVYGFLTPAFLIPFLLFAITAVARIFGGRALPVLPAWLLGCAFIILLPKVFSSWVFWNSYFLSESYNLSAAILAFSLLPLFKARLGWMDILLAVLLTAMAASAKGSVGLILAGIWVLRIVFLGGFKRRMDLLAAASVCIVVGITMVKSIGAIAPMEIRPLHFVSAFSYRGASVADAISILGGNAPFSWRVFVLAALALASFLLFHFIAVWAVSIRHIAFAGVFSLLKSPVSLYSLGAAAAGILAICLFEIAGGSAFYITNVSFFIALPWLVVYSAEVFAAIPLGKAVERARTAAISGVLGIAVIFYSAGGLLNFVSRSGAESRDPYPIFDALLDLRDTAPLDIILSPDRDAADLVRKSFPGVCWASPFLYPALTERPWAGVIVRDENCVTPLYGYMQYRLSAKGDVGVPLADLGTLERVLWRPRIDGGTSPAEAEGGSRQSGAATLVPFSTENRLPVQDGAMHPD